ncbi:uncharacterized protein C8Q71DRAFT_739039 [Rhodofomes roseus]|uniref:F-box domain-containing protein n=1 Tax=Rhodofomes roseus TaxID=34475 RepID=A0ABQ8KSP9_9APHY|nr:uncharacterized protein C8Q71DRAFT_739039 [Rhodofomes roseus]KAH9841840.1 hypothetical protein C8Q71DRAFT_739039 [Rhodofomes roseus]
MQSTELEPSTSQGSRPGNIAARRGQLLEELVRLHARNVEVKAEINALSPICRLPDELLVAIFMYCVALQGDLDTVWTENSAYFPGQRQRPYSWIVLSQVCRQWRRVALDFPALWSSVFLAAGEDFIAEVLRRSQRMPLDVVVWVDSFVANDKARTLRLVLGELSRCRSLRITMPDAYVPPELENNPAPELRTLKIRNTCTNYPSAPPEFTRLFRGRAPRLECLDLAGRATFDWPLLVSSTLRHLTLSQVDKHSQLDVVQLLTRLRGLPLLETLRLDHALTPCFKFPRNTVLPPPSSINLPRLKSLHITSNLRTCTTLVETLSIPSLNSFSAEIEWRDEVGELGQYVAKLTSTLGHATQNIYALALRHVGPDVHLCCYKQAQNAILTGMRSSNDDGPFCIRLVFVELLYRMEARLPDVFSRLSFAPSIKNLHIEDLALSEALTGTVFRQCEGVTSLRVTNRPAVEVVRVLGGYARWTRPRQQSDYQHQHRPAPYLLPHLEVLMFQCISFGELADGLENTLVQRYEDGAQIKEIHLTECRHITSASVNYLRRVAVEVKWDGVVVADSREATPDLHRQVVRPRMGDNHGPVSQFMPMIPPNAPYIGVPYTAWHYVPAPPLLPLHRPEGRH